MSNESPNVFYVYVLFDWLGVPRYVGKGKDDRWTDHERSTDPINWLKNEFIEQTWIMLGGVPKIKVRENISNEEALNTETTLIKSIGRLDLGTGPLTNMSDGGEGVGLWGTAEQRSKVAVIRFQNLTIDQQKRWIEAGAKVMSPEACSERSKRMWEKRSVEERRDHAKVTRDAITPEIIKRRGRKISETNARKREKPLGKVIRTCPTCYLDFIVRPGDKKIYCSRVCASRSVTPEQRALFNKPWSFNREGATRIAIANMNRTPEQRQKTAKAMRDATSGTRWINNGSKNARLSREIPVPNGWVLGRLPFHSIISPGC